MSAPRTGWPACTACAEAIPAASPIANDGGITRTAANASWVAEMHRPVTSNPSSCAGTRDRKSTRLNSSHVAISYAVFCLKKKTNQDVVERVNREKRAEAGRVQ